MQSMGRYVDEAVKALKAQKAIEFHRLKEAWLDAVGPILAGQAEPTRIRGSVLHVTVSSPAWSQEINLQHRLILARLKQTLKQAPTKITCWVGQPHTAPTRRDDRARAETTEEQVPWAKVAIPEHRQAAIETTLSELHEEAQRAKIRPLLELAVKRELYFLEQGQLPCPICGTMRPAEHDSCDDCERERVEQAERRILRLLARKPWIKLRDVMDLAPWAGRARIVRLKKQLLANLLMQAWQLSEGDEGEALVARMTPEYRRLLIDITMLKCALPKTSLKARHFVYSLGKRLGEAFLESYKQKRVKKDRT